MKIKIERNIPPPNRRGNCYPWRQLEVGESFVAPLNTRGGISNMGKLLGRKFVSERISADKCRIWRVA